MVGLTSKQKEELNAAIYEYLIKYKFTQAAAILLVETGHDNEGAPINSQGGKKDLLEQKWTTIAKL